MDALASGVERMTGEALTQALTEAAGALAILSDPPAPGVISRERVPQSAMTASARVLRAVEAIRRS
jgi:hypothetical protein